MRGVRLLTWLHPVPGLRRGLPIDSFGLWAPGLLRLFWLPSVSLSGCQQSVTLGAGNNGARRVSQKASKQLPLQISNPLHLLQLNGTIEVHEKGEPRHLSTQKLRSKVKVLQDFHKEKSNCELWSEPTEKSQRPRPQSSSPRETIDSRGRETWNSFSAVFWMGQRNGCLFRAFFPRSRNHKLRLKKRLSTSALLS